MLDLKLTCCAAEVSAHSPIPTRMRYGRAHSRDAAAAVTGHAGLRHTNQIRSSSCVSAELPSLTISMLAQFTA